MPHNGQDIPPSPSVKSTSSVKKSSRRGLGRLWPTPGAGQCGMTAKTSGRPIEKSTHLQTQVFLSLSSPTSEPSMENGSEESPSLQGDFHVSPSVVPGSEEARRMTVGSGRKCCALLKRQDPVSCSLRMCLASSEWASMIVFLTWRVKVTPRGRLLFQLAPSMPRTEEIGSGLWPTPRQGKTTDENEETWQVRKDAGKVATPPLTLAVKMWPTPTQRDHKDGSNVSGVDPNGLLGRVINPTPASGSLTAEFVEWLMGYPEGWTDLER